MKSEIAHKIKHRGIPNDKISTPIELAKKCVPFVPFEKGDLVLDPARGSGVFYNNFPDYVDKDWCEIDEGREFMLYNHQVDWVVTNPPYSELNDWLVKACQISRKGFAYLVHLHSITPKRLELIDGYGFGLTFIHLVKVFQWFGMSAFALFVRDKAGLISYDRIVWRGNEAGSAIEL